MKVLVIGSGGREHALVWKIAQSPKVKKIYCAPGNAGIAELAECVDIKVEDLDALAAFAKENQVDLTVVGPEVPLTMGVVDKFEAENLRIFGPSKDAAIIEGSKEFSKEIMVKYGVPTAAYGSFTDAASALAYIDKVGAPIVVKADGLAAGKGVVVAMDIETAKQAVNDIMADHVFGSAGNKVVIEEFLDGEVRYASLKKDFPENAEKLFALGEKQAKHPRRRFAGLISDCLRKEPNHECNHRQRAFRQLRRNAGAGKGLVRTGRK